MIAAAGWLVWAEWLGGAFVVLAVFEIAALVGAFKLLERRDKRAEEKGCATLLAPAAAERERDPITVLPHSARGDVK